MLEKQIKRQRRHRRVRAKIFGTAQRPRFCVFKSASHIYAQLINDEKGKTLLAVSDLSLKKEKKGKTEKILTVEGEKDRTAKVAESYYIGKLIAEKAIEQKIKKVVFDRGGYKYHGIVKSLADGARRGGLEF